MNPDQLKKTIEKIKKLMALSASSNEHEAELALEKAKNLINQYNINLEEYEKEIIQEKYNYPIPIISMGLFENGPFIVFIIGKMFNVISIHSLSEDKADIWLCGYRTNVEITKYACDAVLVQCQSNFREEYKKQRTITFSSAFWAGVATALFTRFQKHSKLSPEMEQWVKENTIPGKKKLEFNASHPATQIGIKAGNEAQLNPGVGATSKGNLLG